MNYHCEECGAPIRASDVRPGDQARLCADCRARWDCEEPWEVGE